MPSASFTMMVGDLVVDGYDFGLTEKDYPIYDESHRSDLNQRILEHYWNYEIGSETFEMFRFSLNRKMRELMPYYNQLYLSQKLKFDPLVTVDQTERVASRDTTNSTVQSDTETHSAQAGVNDTTSSADTSSRAVASETPQMMLAGDGDYATSATDTHSLTGTTTKAESTSDTSESGKSTTSQQGVADGTVERSMTGRAESAAVLIQEWRAAMLNIDMMVIEALSPLFMSIWDTGDTFSDNHGRYAPHGALAYGIDYSH